MERATHICTHCGYEGRPVKPPSDEHREQSDVSKSIARVANLVLPGIGLLIRPLAMFLMLPVHILLWPLKARMNPAKHCPNCGLPLMVSVKSDAGWLAKRKNDIKAGAVVIEQKEEAKTAFGKEVVMPGDEIKPEIMPVPVPEKLPSLDRLLEPEKNDSIQPVNPAEKQAETKPKKPANPDEW